MKNYPFYCPKCRQGILIDVKNLQITVIAQPDGLANGKSKKVVKV